MNSFTQKKASLILFSFFALFSNVSQAGPAVGTEFTSRSYNIITGMTTVADGSFNGENAGTRLTLWDTERGSDGNGGNWSLNSCTLPGESASPTTKFRPFVGYYLDPYDSNYDKLHEMLFYAFTNQKYVSIVAKQTEINNGFGVIEKACKITMVSMRYK